METDLQMVRRVGRAAIGESPILTRHIDEELRGLIVALFMPVFFGLSGLNADLTILRSPDLAPRRRTHCDREYWKISRRVYRRHNRRLVPSRIAGPGMRH
jgi:hypothetical protein